MRLLDYSLPSVHENLAVDEALLLESEAASGAEWLRIWEQPTYAVVLGVSGAVRDDVELEACTADQITVARRASGGGTVLIGPGCLCYSLILDMDLRPELRAVGESYRAILARLGASIARLPDSERLGGDLIVAGRSDLAVASRKVSGSAQKRGRRFLLHHGTLLYGLDLNRVSRCLKQPMRQPLYRGNRPHAQFVVNLPHQRAELQAALTTAWEGLESSSAIPLEAARNLAEQKYAQLTWIMRR